MMSPSESFGLASAGLLLAIDRKKDPVARRQIGPEPTRMANRAEMVHASGS